MKSPRGHFWRIADCRIASDRTLGDFGLSTNVGYRGDLNTYQRNGQATSKIAQDCNVRAARKGQGMATTSEEESLPNKKTGDVAVRNLYGIICSMACKIRKIDQVLPTGHRVMLIAPHNNAAQQYLSRYTEGCLHHPISSNLEYFTVVHYCARSMGHPLNYCTIHHTKRRPEKTPTDLPHRQNKPHHRVVFLLSLYNTHLPFL